MEKREIKLIIEKINAIQQLFLFDVWIYDNRKRPEDTKKWINKQLMEISSRIHMELLK